MAYAITDDTKLLVMLQVCHMLQFINTETVHQHPHSTTQQSVQ